MKLITYNNNCLNVILNVILPQPSLRIINVMYYVKRKQIPIEYKTCLHV